MSKKNDEWNLWIHGVVAEMVEPPATGIVPLFFLNNMHFVSAKAACCVLNSQEITISARENVLSVPSVQHVWESICSFQ